MPRNAVSDLGLHCLPMSQKWDARLIWVKVKLSKLGVNQTNFKNNQSQGFPIHVLCPFASPSLQHHKLL